MQQDLAKLGRDLGAYMRQRRFTQAYIAEEANVNQATVSRFLKKPPQRATLAAQRLCNYAESVLTDATDKGDQTAAQRALDICWSRSKAHAQAVSKILNALAELSEHETDEEVTSG